MNCEDRRESGEALCVHRLSVPEPTSFLVLAPGLFLVAHLRRTAIQPVRSRREL